jgi:hypothetical protein
MADDVLSMELCFYQLQPFSKNPIKNQPVYRRVDCSTTADDMSSLELYSFYSTNSNPFF